MESCIIVEKLESRVPIDVIVSVFAKSIKIKKISKPRVNEVCDIKNLIDCSTMILFHLKE